MNCLKLTSSLFLGALVLTSALPGCGDPKTDTSADTGGSEESGTSAMTQPTDSQGMTTNPMTTEGSMEAGQTMGESTMGETGGSTAITMTSVTDNTTGPPACPDPENQENDAECTDSTGCGCKSGKCFLVPILGGFCGECLTDMDCAPGGCTVPNPIAGVGSTCNEGEPGAGCMADTVCTDPANMSCGTLIDVPGIITVATCGECHGEMGNGDCMDPEAPNCTPTLDVENFTGKFACVPDATVPNNESCNLFEDPMTMEPVGNSACMSGFCGDAAYMGLLHVGICGECNSNADCPMGMTCTDPVIDVMTMPYLFGSVCQ